MSVTTQRINRAEGGPLGIDPYCIQDTDRGAAILVFSDDPDQHSYQISGTLLVLLTAARAHEGNLDLIVVTPDGPTEYPHEVIA